MHTSTTAERATRSLHPVTPEQRAAALGGSAARVPTVRGMIKKSEDLSCRVDSRVKRC